MSAQPTLDIRAQLDELRLLKDGWLEGEGLSPPAPGLDWLQNAFDRHFPDDAPPPHLYPTESGGVQAEWSIGSLEISLDLNLDTRSGEWHALDTEAGEVEEDGHSTVTTTAVTGSGWRAGSRPWWRTIDENAHGMLAARSRPVVSHAPCLKLGGRRAPHNKGPAPLAGGTGPPLAALPSAAVQPSAVRR